MHLMFSLRIDKETAELLLQLARLSERSRAGIIRMLIRKAAQELGLQLAKKEQPRPEAKQAELHQYLLNN